LVVRDTIERTIAVDLEGRGECAGLFVSQSHEWIDRSPGRARRSVRDVSNVAHRKVIGEWLTADLS